MNLDDIKNVWKDDMLALEDRVKVNEEKIQKLEFNKAKTSFDQLLKLSIAGKNMALVYAGLSVAMMYVVRDSAPYLILLAIGSGAMIFSYFQHSALKPLDYGKLSIVALQKEIVKFRAHTSRTAVYDMSIVAIWIVMAGLAAAKWLKGFDIFQTPEKIGVPLMILIGTLGVIVFFSKSLYKDYDKKLKKHEADLAAIVHYEQQ